MKTHYRFGKLYTGDGTCIDDGLIIVARGKILHVGPDPGKGYDGKVFDMRGTACIPGLVDAHSHIALYKEPLGEAGNDYNEWETRDLGSRVLDAIDVFDAALRRALASGITTVCVSPGSAQVLNGYGEVFKLSGKTADEMLLRPRSMLKTALGENTVAANRKEKRYPSTRMGSAHVLRQTLRSVLSGSEPDAAPISRESEELSSRLRSGETRLCIHAHAPGDIVTGLRIAREAGLRPIFLHATGLPRVMDSILPGDAEFILGPFLYGNWKAELADLHLSNLGRLHEAGYRFAVSSDHPFTPCEYLLGTIVLAQGFGLEFNFGLQTLTSIPASILGVSGRVGSLRPGLDADFVVLSGDPDCAKSSVLRTYIDGLEVYSKCSNQP